MRRLIFLVLILAAAGGGYWWWSHRTPAVVDATAQGRRGGLNANVPVLAVPVAVADVPIYLDGLGTIQASANVTVKAQVDGKLASVLFTEGQDVTAGTVLAQIDPRAYQAALDQAKAKKAQDEATLANDRLDVIRYTKLAANAYASAQQADTARSTVAQMEAQVAGDQAQIDTATVNLSYTTITAPIAGRIGIRQVDPGNIVHASDTTGICVITTLRPIDAVFTLPQQSLRQVTRAMEVAGQSGGKPEVLALAQDSAANGPAAANVLDHGELIVLDNQVDPTTGTIKMKARFPNEHLQLWPGGFVNVRLKVETRMKALTVPPVTIQRGPQGAYVYVVGADDTVSRRVVQIGHEDATVVVIAQGLTAGERVVTDGASRLSEGSRVHLDDPAAVAPAPKPRTRPNRPAGAPTPAPA